MGAALLGSATVAGAQATGTAQVILARAPVEFVAKGQTAAQPLQKGAKLSEGDRIRTGKGGAAEVVLGDGSLVRLAELSDLEIDKLDVDAANQPVTSHFNLASGRRARLGRPPGRRQGRHRRHGTVRDPVPHRGRRGPPDGLRGRRRPRLHVRGRGRDPEHRSAGPGLRPVRAEPLHGGEEAAKCQIIPMREKRRLLSLDRAGSRGRRSSSRTTSTTWRSALSQPDALDRADDRDLDRRSARADSSRAVDAPGQGTAWHDVTVTVK